MAGFKIHLLAAIHIVLVEVNLSDEGLAVWDVAEICVIRKDNWVILWVHINEGLWAIHNQLSSG